MLVLVFGTVLVLVLLLGTVLVLLLATVLVLVLLVVLGALLTGTKEVLSLAEVLFGARLVVPIVPAWYVTMSFGAAAWQHTQLTPAPTQPIARGTPHQCHPPVPLPGSLKSGKQCRPSCLFPASVAITPEGKAASARHTSVGHCQNQATCRTRMTPLLLWLFAIQDCTTPVSKATCQGRSFRIGRKSKEEQRPACFLRAEKRIETTS